MQLRLHFESKNLFYENQYGFREKKDTSLAISKLMENLYQSFNDSEIKQGVFMDFSKAFDTIDHEKANILQLYTKSHRIDEIIPVG